MINRIVFPGAVAVLLLVNSCALHRNWRYDQLMGLGSKENVLWLPYENLPNSVSEGGVGEFPLLYFTKDSFNPTYPTILFCAGGPGEVVESNIPFLDSLPTRLNVVSFHFRGTGFSQFPASNAYDIFLRTQYAVEDIERIRKHLRIERWFAIIGYSYGTVLAQQYAGTYGRNGQLGYDRVEHLILIAPLSREHAQTQESAQDLATKIRDRQTKVFDSLYDARIAPTASNDGDSRRLQSDEIKDKLKSVLSRVENKFGDLQFVIDNFTRLKNGFRRDFLKQEELDYSQEFFKAVRNLRLIGWFKYETGDHLKKQNVNAIVIARELVCQTQAKSWVAEVTIDGDFKHKLSYCEILNGIKEFSLDLQGSAVFDPSLDAKTFADFVKQLQIAGLGDIYDEDISELRPFKEKIKHTVDEILTLIAKRFGGLQFVIKNFDELKTPPPMNSVGAGIPMGEGAGGPQRAAGNFLRPGGLEEYPIEFFKALHRLLYARDEILSSREKIGIGVLIAKVLEERVDGLKEQIGHWPASRFDSAKEFINHIEAAGTVPQWVKTANEKIFERLSSVYTSDAYETPGYRRIILDEIKKMLDSIEVDFKGCLACAIKTDISGKLTNQTLRYYDREIIEALYALIDYEFQGYPAPGGIVEDNLFTPLSQLATGFNFLAVEKAPPKKETYSAALIGKSIACEMASKLETHADFGKSMPTIKGSNSYCAALKLLKGEGRSNSRRVYNVVSVYDGTDVGFLQKWWKNQPDLRKGLRESAGTVHVELCGRLWSWRRCREELNEEIERMSIVQTDILKPWNPTTFKHTVSTLILEGTADPVTAGNQAEHIFNRALEGPRVKLTFPGIGHEMALPTVKLARNPEETCIDIIPLAQEGGSFVYQPTNIRSCLIAEYLFLAGKDLQNSEIFTKLSKTFETTTGSPIQIEVK